MSALDAFVRAPRTPYCVLRIMFCRGCCVSILRTEKRTWTRARTRVLTWSASGGIYRNLILLVGSAWGGRYSVDCVKIRPYGDAGPAKGCAVHTEYENELSPADVQEDVSYSVLGTVLRIPLFSSSNLAVPLGMPCSRLSGWQPPCEVPVLVAEARGVGGEREILDPSRSPAWLVKRRMTFTPYPECTPYFGRSTKSS